MQKKVVILPKKEIVTSTTNRTKNISESSRRIEHKYIQPYQWRGGDVTDDNGVHYRINIFGHNEIGEPTLWRVENFTPWIYLELPNSIDWTDTKVSKIVAKINLILKDHSIEKHGLLYKKRLYYSSKKEYPLILVAFRSMEALIHCVNLLKRPLSISYNEKIKIKTWEADIDQELKLIAMRGIQYSGWIQGRCEEIKYDDIRKISTNNNEYIVAKSSLELVPDEKTKHFKVRIPSLLSFDGEMNAENRRAMPKAHNANDYCVMYSAHFVTQDRENLEINVKKYILVFGVCGDIEGVEIRRFNSEKSLIYGLCDLIKELDPTIVLGYNLLGFDFDYTNKRLTRKLAKWKNISRLMSHDCKIDGTEWESSAYNEVKVIYLDMPGRIVVDMLYYIKREGYKLDSYKLGPVSKHFIKMDKVGLEAEELFDLIALSNDTSRPMKEREDAMRRIADYCNQDGLLPWKLFLDLFTWIGLVEISNIVSVPIFSIYTQGMTVRSRAMIFLEAYKKNFFIDVRQTPALTYSGGFVFTPIPGLHFHVLCFDFAKLYPSIMMALNICYTTLINENDPDSVNISDDECNVVEWDDIIKDKIVDPTTGKPITVKRNVHNRFRFKKEPMGLIPAILYRLADARDAAKTEIKKLVTARKNFENLERIHRDLHVTGNLLTPSDTTFFNELKQKYKDIDEKELTLKQQIEQLIEETKKNVNTVLEVVFDKRQDGHKKTMNSMYGGLGANFGQSLKEGAMSVTAFARYLIHVVEKIIKEKYNGEVVYGDTDSCMVKFPPGTFQIEKFSDFGRKVAKDISSNFPPPVCIEFEKGFKVVICIKKKKYAYILLDEKNALIDIDNINGQLDNADIQSRGIVLSRRDNCGYLREDVYYNVIKMIMTGKSINDILRFVEDSIFHFMSHSVPLKNLIITRKMGKDYKQDNNNMFLFGNYLIGEGQNVVVGDRLEYVYVETEDPDALQGYKMQSPDLFYKYENKIDLHYYLLHQLANPIDQALTVAFKDYLDKVKDGISYRAIFNTPVKKKFPKTGEQIKYVGKTLANTIKLKTDMLNLFKTSLAPYLQKRINTYEAKDHFLR